LLATGGVLLTSGPLRAALRNAGVDDRPGWVQLLLALLSLLAVFSLFTFFTQYANAFTHPNIIAGHGPDGETFFWNLAGISAVLVPATLMMGFILLAIRRWTLPIGSLTLLLTTNAALMFILESAIPVSIGWFSWPPWPGVSAG
jgi:hypothetical protein